MLKIKSNLKNGKVFTVLEKSGQKINLSLEEVVVLARRLNGDVAQLLRVVNTPEPDEPIVA